MLESLLNALINTLSCRGNLISSKPSSLTYDLMIVRLSSVVLWADPEGELHDDHFDYQSVVGKMNYWSKSTQSDIKFDTNQVSRFMANPKHSHARAVKCIGCYLLATKELRLIVKPIPNQSMDVFVDASFAGEWIKGIKIKQYTILTLPDLVQDLPSCMLVYHLPGDASYKEKSHSHQLKLSLLHYPLQQEKQYSFFT